MTGSEIAHLISRHKYVFDNEDELQLGIAAVLERAGVEAEREVKINATDRLDFLAGSIAIEIKIAGSRPQILTQLHRYAQSERVSEIVLVSLKARHHGLPFELNGKRIHM